MVANLECRKGSGRFPTRKSFRDAVAPPQSRRMTVEEAGLGTDREFPVPVSRLNSGARRFEMPRLGFQPMAEAQAPFRGLLQILLVRRIRAFIAANGLIKIIREEGARRLGSGGSQAHGRYGIEGSHGL